MKSKRFKNLLEQENDLHAKSINDLLPKIKKIAQLNLTSQST